nr:hypothetical protein [Ferruginibacter sp.]
MQNTEEYKKSFSLSLKPALMVAVLAIFFIFNIYSLSQINNNEVDKAIKQQQNISIDTYTYVYSTNNQEIY